MQFTDVGNMKRGNPVKVSGVQSGKVEEITFIATGRRARHPHLDQQGGCQPKTDATAALSSVGLAGDVDACSSRQVADGAAQDAVIKGSTERGLFDIGGELTGEAKAYSWTPEAARGRQQERLARTWRGERRRCGASRRLLLNNFSDPKTGPAPEMKAHDEGCATLATARLDSVLGRPGPPRARRRTRWRCGSGGSSEQFTVDRRAAGLRAPLVQPRRGHPREVRPPTRRCTWS